MGLFDKFKKAKPAEKTNDKSTVRDNTFQFDYTLNELKHESETRKRIMIVNSDTEAMDKIWDWLESAGYKVVARAEDIVDAIEMYDDYNDDLQLVVVDMEMRFADEDGIEVMETLKEYNPDVPFLLTSVPEEMRERTLEAGASAVLDERYYEYDFVEAVKNLIG